MHIYRTSNYYEMSRKAANLIAAQVTMKPDSVLGLATGSTPEGIYQQLISKYYKGELDFSNVKTVNLDEYKGLSSKNNQSYQYYMVHKLFNHINIKPEHYHLPNGLAEDSEAECVAYDNLIEDLGNVDLQLLGLGLNGHIGFNEPADEFAKGTHLVSLTQSTIDANSRFFDRYEDIPRYAYTMGIKNIMQARKIVVVVNGRNKAEILKQVVTGPITPKVPASILQLHNDVTIIADNDALSLLK